MSALDDLIAQVQAQTPGLLSPNNYLNLPVGSAPAVPTPAQVSDQLQQQQNGNGNGS